VSFYNPIIFLKLAPSNLSNYNLGKLKLHANLFTFSLFAYYLVIPTLFYAIIASFT